MVKFKWVEKAEASGEHTVAIKITDGIFNGMVFSYGAVKFIEHGDEDAVTLKFDYDIHRYPHGVTEETINGEDLEYVLGGLLTELIKQQLENNELIFTGGTDEPNREDDSFELDTQ